MIMILQILAGLGLLLAGGEAMVRGAVALGRWMGLSPLVVGILIIGVATSMPEMVISVEAVLLGHPEIAIGNILGSNSANIMLVLALTALVRPMHHQPRALVPDGLIVGGVALLFVVLGFTGRISLPEGLIMLGGLAAYMAWEFTRTRKETKLARELEEELEEAGAHPVLDHPAMAFVLVVVGLGTLVYGGDLFLRGATAVADLFGVSKGVIGLTLVALGTSAPELASSLVAARHGHSDVAYGNIVGSNIINVLGVGGAAAVAGSLPFPSVMAGFDGPVMLAATLLMILFFHSRAGLTRMRGLLLFASYLLYVGVRATILHA